MLRGDGGDQPFWALQGVFRAATGRAGLWALLARIQALEQGTEQGGTKEEKAGQGSAQISPCPMASADVSEAAPSSPCEASPPLVTCGIQDISIGLERCRAVPSVGDLHCVCVDVTGNDTAKVQDVFGQLSSERTSKDTL